MKRILIWAFAATAAVSMTAQKTTMLTADKAGESGLVYFLPQTSLEITVKATQTVKVPGPYYRFAKRYVGTDDVITDRQTSWTIDEVSVRPVGSADQNKKYVMQIKGGAPTYICVAPDGMLLSINTETELPGAAPADKEEKGDTYTGKEYLQYVTGDFLASQSTAKQAQMLAESIMDVRDARISLTRGTADTMPSDGKQLELMLHSLADQEQAMMRAFTGYEEITKVQRTFSFTPASEGGREVLFRLSMTDGFVAADDLSGEPVYISISNIKEARIPVEDGKERKMPKDGVVYVLPGTADVMVTYKGATLWQNKEDFAQYGDVFSISHLIFTDRKSPQFAIFDPTTGALREVGDITE